MEAAEDARLNGPGARLRAWLSAGVPPVLEPRSFARLRAALFAAALLPLARLLHLGAAGGLGANPVEFVIRSLGTWALVALVVTLSITPLRLAFFYAALHLLAYLWLDHWFDTAAIWGDVTKRPYIAAGLVAMALLVPLAVTSSNGWVKRLGGRNWQRLHRLVYVIAALAVVHFWWQKAAKNDVGEPLLYAVVIGLLLGVRALRWARRRYGSVDSSANSSSTDSRRRTS